MLKNLLILSLLVNCGAASAALNIQDDEGRQLTLPAPAMRIVSLAPGATAMLFAAGAGERVVGTAEYSDEPEAARRIPRVGDSQGFDTERILKLHPDVIVAWSQGTSAAQIEKLERLGLRVYRHRINRLDELPAALRRLAHLTGTEGIAEPLARSLELQLGVLRDAHQKDPAPSVLIQIWDQPLFTVGNQQLLSDALAACGYRNLYADLGAAAGAIGLESVLARGPQLIVAIAPDAGAATEWLQRWRQYPSLPAVASGRLVPVIDQRFSRMGPSTVAATADLCAQLDGGS
jgi:iron complex transport system substrate-binding protein